MSQEPLHETVLRVVFLVNPDRPVPMSTDEIFWKVEIPHLSMVKLKEVLEWLIRQGDMDKDLSKYVLSRHKFFELKTLYGTAKTALNMPVEAKEKPKKRKKSTPAKTFRSNSHTPPEPKSQIVAEAPIVVKRFQKQTPNHPG